MNLFLNPPSEDLIRFVTAHRLPKPRQTHSPLFAQRHNADEIRDMLSCLNPDMPYQDWISVGMALHAGGYDVSLWDNWSAQSVKYKPSECQNKWAGFQSGGGVGIGTLVQMAKQAGYGYMPVILPNKSKVDSFSQFKAYHWSEIDKLPRRKYLIKGLLEQGGMSVIYGASNTGKTFIGLDMACHVALGWEWQGRKTRAGKVVYIAAEGGLGIRERLEAFRVHHKMSDYADIFIIPSNVCLCGEDTDLEAFLKSLAGIDNIKLIVVDTLARAMGGADENTAKDMGSFIQNCDFIREATKAHVMIIHHSGKDETRGARGSNALKGAIDTEVHVTQDNGIISAQVAKQRDGMTGKTFSFVLQSYEVGQDEDGDAIKSCALENAEVPEQKRKLSAQTNKAYLCLVDLMLEAGTDYTPRKGMKPQKVVRLDKYKEHFIRGHVCKTDEPDSVNKAFSRCRTALQNLGYTAEWDGYIWITDKADK